MYDVTIYKCQNHLDNECSLLTKREAVRPYQVLALKRSSFKNSVQSFDYLRLVAEDKFVSAILSIVCINANDPYIFELLP